METEKAPKRFNIKVTYRNEETGLVERQDPYVLRVVGENHAKLFERPKGSGNLFGAKDEPCGRWIIDAETKKGKWDPKAEHIEFKAPLTDAEQIAQAFTEKDQKIDALMKELEAIKLQSLKAEKTKPSNSKA